MICGFYAITRGQWIDKPDGTRKKVGKIFKSWWFFWMQEKGDKIKIYYMGYDLQRISREAANIGDLTFLGGFEGSIDYRLKERNSENDLINLKIRLQESLGVKVELITKSDGSINIRFYEDEPNFLFPDWVRDMTAGCITCHASIYGTIFFVSFHSLVREEILHNVVYGWVNPIFVIPTIIATWIAYCFSLSYIMTVLWKKF